jgi:hypothetical protein
VNAVEHLEQVIREGTTNPDFSRTGKPSGKIVCADGFTVSVQAGHGMYCSPRPALNAPKFEADQITGPYTSVEIGFPSARPEPWSEWEQWCESPDSPTDTVYGYVPVDAVRALVAFHERVTS